jgi:hypothetical protein
MATTEAALVLTTASTSSPRSPTRRRVLALIRTSASRDQPRGAGLPDENRQPSFSRRRRSATRSTRSAGRSDAVRLFVEAAAAARPGFALTGLATGPVILEHCWRSMAFRRIEPAAAMPALSLEQIRERLGPFEVLLARAALSSALGATLQGASTCSRWRARVRCCRCSRV